MTSATARAFPNIALVKYWGKRDESLMLPAAGSLSLTLDAYETTTAVDVRDDLAADEFVLNGAAQTGMDRAAQATQNARANQMASLKPQTPIAAPTQNSVPAEAPAGTDPELWNVLTSEERNFFAKTSALGPLTYGRYKAAVNPAAPPAARGVRLDVRA